MKDFISIYKALKDFLQFLTLIITVYTFVDVQKEKTKNKRKQKNVPSRRRNI